MHSFKKVMIVSLSFVILLCSFSAAVIQPYYNSESFYYLDKKVRESVAGTLDFFVIGSSHAMAGFKPEIIDKKLSCSSYNLSCSMMPLDAKYKFLEKELNRNNADTVVVELSYTTLLRNEKEEYAIGQEPTIARLDSNFERLGYLLKNVGLNDYTNVYSRSFVSGLAYLLNIVMHKETKEIDYLDKGFHQRPIVDLRLSEDEVNETYNTSSIKINYSEENLRRFNEIIALCKKRCKRTIVVVVPVSDRLIWKTDNFDLFLSWTEDYCQENDLEFFDFNIYKQRNILFTDEDAYNDADHMSFTGAERFTTAFSDILLKVDNGEDVSQYFYSSYAEMKQDSPYMKYLKN